MPVQKRSHEAREDDAPLNDVEQQEKEAGNESDRSESSNDKEKEEYVLVKLSDVRKEFQCPICLGIIRKTRTVMECLHRFCRECIDKSMRLGNNECPACRTHCASRRSLRDDPNFDALIATLYQDIDKYEEEDLALHEDEMAHNKQIQASIAETQRRQSEALSKKRNAKATAVPFVRRFNRPSHQRRRRNLRNAGEVSCDSEDMNDNDGGKDSSSGDEQTEAKPKRGKRGGEREAQFPQDSSSSDSDGAGDENIPEVNREIMSRSPSGTLSWGKNGQRSHTRGNGKNTRNSRISKLVDHLRNLEVNDDELDIPLMLVTLDEQSIPNLPEPYFSCKPTMSVKQLCQHVALKSALQADEVELCLVIEPQADFIRAERTVDPNKDTLRVLVDQETLAELTDYHNISCGYLIMAYRKKLQNSDKAGPST